MDMTEMDTSTLKPELDDDSDSNQLTQSLDALFGNATKVVDNKDLPKEEPKTNQEPYEAQNEDEGSNAAENAANEPLEAKKEDPKPGTDPAQAQTPVEPPKETLPAPQDQIQEPRGLNPQNKANWRALRAKAEQFETLTKQQGERLAQLEAQVNQPPQLPPEVQNELQELRQWRLMTDIQSTPEFQQHFDKAIESNDEGIYAQMRALYSSSPEVEAAIKQIKASGGVEKVPPAWWDANIIKELEKSSSIEAQQFRNSLLKGQDLRQNRQSTIEQSKAKLGEYQQQRQVQAEQHHKQFADTEQKEIQSFLKQFPEAQFKQAPANATPEQKTEIEAHNKRFQQYIDRDTQMIKGLQSGDPTVMTQMRLSANAAFYFKDQLGLTHAALQQKDAQIADLQKQLTGIKTAGAMAKAGSAAPTAKAQAHSNIRSYDDMSDKDAIFKGLNDSLSRTQ